MDDDNYDEFGNYIRPEVESDEESSHQEEQREEQPSDQVVQGSNEHQIVLH